MIKPHGHKTQSVTGGVILAYDGVSVTPRAIMAVAIGGTATLAFENMITGATMPQAGRGDSDGLIRLLSNIPVEFDLEGENMDSMTVTLGTATSVELIWQI